MNQVPPPAHPKAEAWRKTNHPCNVCDKQAIGCYSPDLDIKGLCFCKKHKEEVMLAYYSLVGGDEKLAKSMMKGWKHG